MTTSEQTTFEPAAFDHHTVEHSQHWRETFAEARATTPVIHSETWGGFDVLTKHADVTAALRDHKRFSSERSWDAEGNDLMLGVAIPQQPIRVGFLEMDPPESLNYRRLLNRWFTRGSIDRGRGRIEECATWAINRVIGKGECDIITDLAAPFQCVSFLDMLGMPLDRWKTYKEISDALTNQEHDALEKIEWMRGDLKAEIIRQRAEGGEGLIADLVTCEVDGAPISDDMAAELALMLLLGGESTTISTIGNLLLHLHRNRTDRADLLADPSLMETAVDEMLRYYAPSPGLARTVTAPVTIRDHEFTEGDRVLLSFASANYDPEVFANPDVVDIRRSPNPHLAFGAGVHRCIGSLLARANAEHFLLEVLRAMPEYTIDDAGVRPCEHAALNNGFFSIPMSFPAHDPSNDAGDFPHFTAARISPV